MTTDTTEKGPESIIVRAMTGRVDLLSPPYMPTETSTPVSGGTGWILGDPKHYDRGACVDLVQLRGFLMVTQPKIVEAISLETGPTRRQFLARLQKEIGTGFAQRRHGSLQAVRGTPRTARTANRFRTSQFQKR